MLQLPCHRTGSHICEIEVRRRGNKYSLERSCSHNFTTSLDTDVVCEHCEVFGSDERVPPAAYIGDSEPRSPFLELPVLHHGAPSEFIADALLCHTGSQHDIPITRHHDVGNALDIIHLLRGLPPLHQLKLHIYFARPPILSRFI
jgi:hypothetical protein